MLNKQVIPPIWGFISLLVAVVSILIFMQQRVDASYAGSYDLIFPEENERKWIVTPTEAKKMLLGGALLIDARGTPEKLKLSSPNGSISILWQDLSLKAMSEKGLPLALNDAEKKLNKLGMNSDQPIVVLGDWKKGWGEDGRVVWTLRRWGYQHVVMVNGGFHALQALGIPVAVVSNMATNINLKDISGLEISIGEVKAKLLKPDVTFIDVREPREFDGKTPYGEARGGHLPSAKNIWFKLFLNEDGGLQTKEQIHQLLAKQGVHPNKEIIVYGSGGFRSGWVTAVLRDMGYQARNYAGSMWQWSDRSILQYPLVTNR